MSLEVIPPWVKLAHHPLLPSQVMNSTAFPSGMHYFEMTRRMFAFEHPCADCVAVHNNWLVGTDAKMYRWGRWGCREAVPWAIAIVQRRPV
jgi:hypothetical protein